ncbi:hypothetical protein AAFF_G00075110 [Aldrovandia affinis]|uniref:Uncharacterized protein n=1 Tax=Aldrovandia affinis TaxID=143900 RepID=A0AAD7RXU6_9TELE|nr:hypothetical protein AAFF_G00075110 [Aldrovandia affinis]
MTVQRMPDEATGREHARPDRISHDLGVEGAADTQSSVWETEAFVCVKGPEQRCRLYADHITQAVRCHSVWQMGVKEAGRERDPRERDDLHAELQRRSE